MSITPRLLPGTRKTRADQVADAIRHALAAYAPVINANGSLRSVNIDVKFRSDGTGVRTVIVSIQAETELSPERD